MANLTQKKISVVHAQSGNYGDRTYCNFNQPHFTRRWRKTHDMALVTCTKCLKVAALDAKRVKEVINA